MPSVSLTAEGGAQHESGIDILVELDCVPPVALAIARPGKMDLVAGLGSRYVLECTERRLRQLF